MRSSNPHHPPLLPPAHIGLLLLLASTIILYKRNRMHSWKSLYSIHFTRSIQSLVVLVVPVEYCSNPSLSLSLPHTHAATDTGSNTFCISFSAMRRYRARQTNGERSGRPRKWVGELWHWKPCVHFCFLAHYYLQKHFIISVRREKREGCVMKQEGVVCVRAVLDY